MYFALLDILRFLSSLSVAGYHIFSFSYGRLGVYLFFMISGFVIYFSLHKDLKEYAWGRFLRLYPLFWICCTITYLVTVFYGENLPIKNYFISMLLVNDGKNASMIDGSYWTLTFEFLFYLYVGVFVWLFSIKRLDWFCFSWLSISFLSFLFNLNQTFIAKLLCVRLAPFFVFGIILALIFTNYSLLTLRKKFFYLMILVVSYLMPIYISYKLQHSGEILTNSTSVFNNKEMFIIEILFIIMALGVYFSNMNFLKRKNIKNIFYVFGGITYPLYLLHSKIAETIIKGEGYPYGGIHLFSFVVVFLLIVISYILFKYDLILRKFLKQKYFNSKK